MESLEYPFLPATLLAEARRHVASTDDLLTFLRTRGLSKAESMIALSEVMHVAPGAAKLAVLNSDAWRSTKELDVLYQQAALKSVGDGPNEPKRHSNRNRRSPGKQ